jgi:hypothetical protein
MKTKKSTLFLALSLASTLAIGQQIGKKAVLLEDGSFSAEEILLPEELANARGGFTQLDNFPFETLAHPNFKNFRGAAVADINNNGQHEILFAAWNKLYALDGDGEIIWERTLNGTATLPPTIADINGDGNLEIIQNTGGIPNNGRVYLVDAATGEDLDGWPLNFNNHWMINASAVADVNGDGNLEIIFCERVNATEGYIHVVDINGDPINENWPIDIGGTPAFTPSIGDVNGDGTMNVVISSSSGNLFVFDVETGENIDGFPFTASGMSFSYQSPILVDLDNDGTLEIVGANHGDSPAFFVVKSDGTFADGWPYGIGEWTYSPPTVADIDGDGTYELFFGNRNTSNDETPLDVVYGFNYEGDAIDNFPINKYGGTEGVMTIADINDDGVMDIIFPSIMLGSDGNGYIHAYSTDGSGELPGFPLRPEGFTFINGAVLGDVNGDGMLNLVANSYTQNFGASDDMAYVNVYNLNVPYDPEKILSNGYKGNNHRNGLVEPEGEMGVTDNNKLRLNIVPNPSNGILTLQIPNSLNNATLQLFSLDGKLIHLQKNINLEQGNNTFRLEQLPSGMYLISLGDGQTTFTGKWIKK